MLGNKLINTNAGGGCTDTVDLYNPFPDGGGVALYQLNGNATDVSGNYDGTASNVTYGAGQFGQAGVFNGSSSYVQLPSLINFGLSNYTISLWFKVSNVNVFQSLFSTYGTPNNQGIIISQQSNGTVRFFASGSQGIAIATSELTVADTWYNVVCTMDHKASAKIYLNGQLKNQYTVIQQTIGSDAGANPNIGKTPSGIAYTNGSIDQVRIFNRVLRPYEVEALYTEEYCTPTIVPSEHFNTVLWTGDNATSRDITGVGFQPGFTWIKSRTLAASHGLYDSVRGAGYWLRSEFTNAEQFQRDTGYLNGFIADGFNLQKGTSTNPTYTGWYETNQSGQNYVAWNFKAGGAAVTNTDGTITSQVSANTESGFSVVSYTTQSSGTATVGHGLNTEPNIVLVKTTGVADSWRMYHSSLGANYQIYLNLTNAAGSTANQWNNTAPSSSVFTLGTDNAGSYATIAYCFAEVEGFSNFGSYVGTGNPATAPVIVTGFEPAMIIVKSYSAGSAKDWVIYDNKRGNADNYLLANTSGAEGVYDNLDFLENGFKITDTGSSLNQSGTSYIYMAFAADPTAVEPSLEDSFNTVLYSGNNSTNAITGVGFEPDMVWVKNRFGYGHNHVLSDTLRGVEKFLLPNLTNAEISSGGFGSFDSDGFTLNSSSSNAINEINFDYVAWAWKGAEIPAINSNGSIPSVVSANPAAGFSIVSYNGVANATVGHGLGTSPSVIIAKALNATNNWAVYHSDLGSSIALELNTTSGSISATNYWGASGIPNSTVFGTYGLGGAGNSNGNTIAYCFAEVAGFSKFGSYTGTGAAGNFQDCGFEPAFVMIKITNTTSSWFIWDNKRSPSNPRINILEADDRAAAYNSAGPNFLPTGFDFDSDSYNNSGLNFIYMAFANQF